MKLFEKRPLALFCTVVLATGALFANAGLALKASVACAALAFAIAAFWVYKISKRIRLLWGFCLLAVCLSLGTSMLSIDRRVMLAESLVKEDPVEMSAIVVDGQSDTSYTVRLTKVGKKECKLKVRLYEYDLPLSVGDVLHFNAKINTDYNKYGDGIFARVEEVDSLSVVMHKNTIKARLCFLRDGLVSKMQGVLPKDNCGLFLSLLIGDKSLLSDGTELSFRRLGLSHMLAVSGLHVSVLCAALAFFCRKILHISRKRYFYIGLAFVLFYCLFTGASAGVIRATVMSAAALIAFTAARGNDSMTSLFAAAAGISLFSPTSVFDVGFWLSVTATLGVLMAVYFLGKWRLPKNRFLASLITLSTITVSATVTTLPLSIFYFGEYSMLSLPANLAFGFLLQVCLVCALLLAFICFIPLVGPAFGTGVSYFETFVCRSVNACAGIKGVVAELSFLQTKVLWILFSIVLILFICLDRKRHKWLVPSLSVAFACAIFVSSVCHVYSQSKREIVYESNAGTDSFLYSKSGAHHLILSAGGSLGAMLECEKRLSALHISELETLVLTHCHTGHGQYLSALLEGVKVHTVMLPDSYDTSAFEDISNIAVLLQSHGAKVAFYKPSETIALGEMTLDFMPTACSPYESRHDGYAFSALVGEMEFLSFNVSYALYGDKGALYDRMLRADALILAGHTLPAIDETKNQSVCIAPENVQTIILPQEDAIAFIEADHSYETFVAAYRFSLK